MEEYFIFCINLKKNLLRRKVMLEQLRSFNFTICEAIDHKDISFTKDTFDNFKEYRSGHFSIHGHLFNFNIKSKEYYQIVKNNGHVGCTLSHLFYIKNAYDLKYENIIMLEDDISFKYINRWNHKFKSIIKNAPNDWTILKLHCSNYEIVKKYFKTEQYINIPKDSVLFWSTGFYIINSKGMEYLIDKYFDSKSNTFHINENFPVADYILYKIPGVYYYSIPLVKNNNIDYNFKSDILNRNVLTNSETKGINIVDDFYSST